MSEKDEFDQLKERIEQAHRHHEQGNYDRTRSILRGTVEDISELDERIQSAQALMGLEIDD